MKTFATRAIASLALASLAFAAFGQKPMKMKPMMMMKCPVCNMALSMKKTKANPIAVRLKKGGKVMYCCSGCKMPAKWRVKA